MGGSDFFSNGIHLNVIEAADDPAAESWRNLHAIDDVVREIIETDSHLVHLRARRRRRRRRRAVRARGRPRGRARGRRAEPVLPAHGRPLRLGVLDLPAAAPGRRRAAAAAHRAAVHAPRHPPGGRDRAARRRFGDDRWTSFRAQVRGAGRAPRARPGPRHGSTDKRRRRARDEALKPLRAYRREELARSHECFFGARPQLPRGAPALRPQARRSVRRHAGGRDARARSATRGEKGGVDGRRLIGQRIPEACAIAR